ncbi:MAG TPA: helix-turn-helix transcriptional regulator [Thermomicrobiales bacterium]|nr:helix-turn-helix transcriptional regulator [Thermomicrobiales bacterium]
MWDRIQRLASAGLPPQVSPDTLSDNLVADHQLIRRWFSEALLLWAHWGLVGVLVLLAILFPARSQWLILLLAAATAAVNIVNARLLRTGIEEAALARVAALATLVEWGVALGVSVAFRRELDSVSPYVLLLALLPVSYRYGVRGLVGGFVAVGLIATVWFGLHLTIYDLVTADTLRSLVIEWIVFLVLAVLFIGALILADSRRGQWEHRRLQTFRRERAGLSNREWEVLLLVAESDLTYEDIGYLLNISPETVKTHVRRIGEKLAARGRDEVVRKAREQDLLPAEQETTVTN